MNEEEIPHSFGFVKLKQDIKQCLLFVLVYKYQKGWVTVLWTLVEL